MNFSYRNTAVLIALLVALPTKFLFADTAPLTFIFQKQKNPAQTRVEADRIADFLSQELGRKVTARVPGSYAASVQALVSQKADIAYVDSLNFLLARRDGDAKVLLAEERVDQNGKARTDYDSIFVVRNDSPLKDIHDVVKNASKLNMIFTSPTSTSGYVMAYRRFIQEGLLKSGQHPKEVFQKVGFGGSYAQALEQVLNGRGDLCAVSYYALEGPSANRYLSHEQRSKLRVLDRTPGVPTHVIAARDGLSPVLTKQITNALLRLSTEQPELLSDVYGASRFVPVKEQDHVRASVEAVQYLELPLEDLTKKKS